MAADLSSLNTATIDVLTTGASDVVLEILLPPWTGSVSLYFETYEGKYARAGTDGAAIGTDYMVIPADMAVEVWRKVRGREAFLSHSIFIATSSPSTTVRIEVCP